ncbi:NUDIX domain-containing protein [Rhodococcus sp. NPDC058521]|uniref:NUDIX hydrolase n=1 Tax=Rhodococcus sp. NPDC058521 TaxID=3346536 RepID=UPI003658A3FD
MEWKDANGRALTDYPRPSVAVDVAVLTVHNDAVQALTVRHGDGMALPGTFLHPGETLADAAHRALGDKAGIGRVRIHQLRMFDDPDRDDRGWVVSMAHGATIPAAELPPNATVLPCDDPVVADLAFDHRHMVGLALADLRERYARRPDPDHLLGDSFTILELRRLYEIVFSRPLPKDSFRRHVIEGLVSTGETSSIGGGRPAETFRRCDLNELPRSAAALFTE